MTNILVSEVTEVEIQGIHLKEGDLIILDGILNGPLSMVYLKTKTFDQKNLPHLPTTQRVEDHFLVGEQILEFKRFHLAYETRDGNVHARFQTHKEILRQVSRDWIKDFEDL